MKYIASFSGGKDSTASIILAHEHNEPIDLIIFSEVMFDKNISGELPEHIDFIKNKAAPLFESWGYEVKIFHADLTYMDIFMREPKRGKRAGTGMKTGFPMSGRCQINSFAPRGGCWFCPNARKGELNHLRSNHPDLWNKLLELERTPDLIGNKFNTLTKTSIHDIEKSFFLNEPLTLAESLLFDSFE